MREDTCENRAGSRPSRAQAKKVRTAIVMLGIISKRPCDAVKVVASAPVRTDGTFELYPLSTAGEGAGAPVTVGPYQILLTASAWALDSQAGVGFAPPDVMQST